MNFARAFSTIRKDGLGTVLRRRLLWYRDRFKGTLIALKGNKIYMDGMTYSVASPQFSSTLKCAIGAGNYEQPERDLVAAWLPADFPVVELGGGLGAVSCLANRKLEDPTRHVVVEANPAMIPVLSTNRDINSCAFTVTNRALAYDAETVPISIDPDFVGSSAVAMTGTRTVDVKTATLTDVMSEYGFERCGVLCDIEGLEAELIEREFPALGERIRYIMAEMHPWIIGRETTDRLLASLGKMGFIEKQTIGDCIFYARA